MISRHLRILREADLVNVERRGTSAYYSLAGETVAALAAALVGEPSAKVSQVSVRT
jgi:DNA-binding transcriptional ArsR family regulator